MDLSKFENLSPEFISTLAASNQIVRMDFVDMDGFLENSFLKNSHELSIGLRSKL